MIWRLVKGVFIHEVSCSACRYVGVFLVRCRCLWLPCCILFWMPSYDVLARDLRIIFEELLSCVHLNVFGWVFYSLLLCIFYGLLSSIRLSFLLAPIMYLLLASFLGLYCGVLNMYNWLATFNSLWRAGGEFVPRGHLHRHLWWCVSVSQTEYQWAKQCSVEARLHAEGTQSNVVLKLACTLKGHKAV
jgi:hypothetical protein